MESIRKEKTNWRAQGSDPDYRFSLANERTFLAWIRTSLAFLAVAIGADQLANYFVNSQMKTILVLLLCGFSALLSIHAFLRWKGNEIAMRNGRGLDYTRTVIMSSLFMCAMSILAVLVMIYDR